MTSIKNQFSTIFENMSKWFTHGTEFISAAMLCAMFLTFMLQIISRYVLLEPFGWTLELCLTLWIWIVFFGNAFIVRKQDHVTFDLLYIAVPAKVRRVFLIIAALAMLGGLLWSLLPTWDYIDWMKIRKSATLKIPMRTVFSVYMIFMIALIIHYAYVLYKCFKFDEPVDDIEDKDTLLLGSFEDDHVVDEYKDTKSSDSDSSKKPIDEEGNL